MDNEKLLIRLEEKVSVIEKDMPKLFKEIKDVAASVKKQFVEYVKNINELVESRVVNLEERWRETSIRHEGRMVTIEKDSAKLSQKVDDMKRRQGEDRARLEEAIKGISEDVKKLLTRQTESAVKMSLVIAVGYIIIQIGLSKLNIL